MQSRRSFLKKAAMLAGTTAVWSGLPSSVRRAFAINPDPGTTVWDAEHIVVLMQENRSFDHCFGSLQGVRGFNDRRPFRLPNNNLVWLQTNSKGETYAPFRLNMHQTKSTWMNGLPHSWADQVDARNNGRYDRWLDIKKHGNTGIPFTLGYYSREDLPFYYAMADAFTICDQHFCSSITGTTPNRLYLWTGTIREGDASTYARVYNGDTDYKNAGSWLTFPEVLEDNGVSWKIYQNEVGIESGFTPEQWSWLANYFDNPMEWFSQYQVRFHELHRKHVQVLIQTLPQEIEELKRKVSAAPSGSKELQELQKKLKLSEESLKQCLKEPDVYTAENFEKLSERSKNLHRKAFCTNVNDPAYRQLIDYKYKDGEVERSMKLPKGDIFYQFRKDVTEGKLPTVSWLVPPQHFSDHPSSPWYGAWCVSEALDILTKNKEVWKKTVFILTYDENDGFFDHIPPYVVPNPAKKDGGAVSEGIDTAIEYVPLDQELKRKRESNRLREGPIGLGYRVPMIVASPWSRGGYVNSQIFDHTSVLQFMEKFLSKKTGKSIVQTPITKWRRTVCGDLNSVFRPYNGEEIKLPKPIERDPYVQSIHQAQFKDPPKNYQKLSPPEISEANQSPKTSPVLPRQEPGTRPSCPIPYELYVDLNLGPDGINAHLAASNKIFGDKAAGSPFKAYARQYKSDDSNEFEDFRMWSFAVSAGSTLEYHWPANHFKDGNYELRIDGPNGFMRELIGRGNSGSIEMSCAYQSTNDALTGNVLLKIKSSQDIECDIQDNAYGGSPQLAVLKAGDTKEMIVDCSKSSGWYDFTVASKDGSTHWTFAGRVETGRESVTDPAAA